MSREVLEAAKLAKELAKLGIRPNDDDASTDFFIATSARETFNGVETVMLNAGDGTDILQYGGKPTAPARWSNERISEALNSIR